MVNISKKETKAAASMHAHLTQDDPNTYLDATTCSALKSNRFVISMPKIIKVINYTNLGVK
jgi:hypothetical protein